MLIQDLNYLYTCSLSCLDFLSDQTSSNTMWKWNIVLYVDHLSRHQKYRDYFQPTQRIQCINSFYKLINVQNLQQSWRNTSHPKSNFNLLYLVSHMKNFFHQEHYMLLVWIFPPLITGFWYKLKNVLRNDNKSLYQNLV